jgi:hypothetical protein
MAGVENGAKRALEDRVREGCGAEAQRKAS